MNKIFRILSLFTAFAITGVIVIIICVESFDRYSNSADGINYFYKNNHAVIKIKKHSTHTYIEIGDNDKPALMLVHGAPGTLYDWSKFAKQKEIYEKYRLIIPTRPGYGSFYSKKTVDIESQADYLLEFLQDETQPSFLLGHSYGAPVAMIMAAKAPTKIAHVFGVSGQYDPNNEVIFSISYWVQYPIFGYLLPRVIWKANQEKLAHFEQLEAIKDLYAGISIPITLVHGKADTLVPFQNSLYLQKKIVQTQAKLILLENKNHPLHMSDSDILAKIVLNNE